MLPIRQQQQTMDVDPSDAAAIALKLQSKARASAKKSAKRTTPLQAKAPAAHKDLDSELQWLQRCQQLFAQLPPTSRWARHKRATVQKAIELLNLKRWALHDRRAWAGRRRAAGWRRWG
jgi:hypothetical protein